MSDLVVREFQHSDADVFFELNRESSFSHVPEKPRSLLADDRSRPPGSHVIGTTTKDQKLLPTSCLPAHLHD